MPNPSPKPATRATAALGLAFAFAVIGIGTGTAPEARAQTAQTAQSHRDAELAGKYVLAFSERNPEALGIMLAGAKVATACDGQTNSRSAQKFLNLWKARPHRISEIETSREGGMLDVVVRESTPTGNLTHRLKIQDNPPPTRLRAIVMEIPPGADVPEPERAAAWATKSLTEAESQFLVTLLAKGPVEKTGKTAFEEGPELESTTIGLSRPETDEAGAAIIVRSKTTGDTVAAAAFEKTGDPLSNEEFRKNRDKASEKLSTDPAAQKLFGQANSGTGT